MANGIIFAMELHIDKAGRIVLPKAIRQLLGVKSGSRLELVPGNDGVLLRRMTEKPSMQQIDGLWVHQGQSAPDADWARVVDGARDERAVSAWTD